MTYAQVTIPYDLEGDDTVPETADVPLIDEQSGTEFERELLLWMWKKYRENGQIPFLFGHGFRVWSRLILSGRYGDPRECGSC